MRIIRYLGALMLGCWGAVGCGSSSSTTHQLKGKVTFAGKPVPAGRVFFLPDSTKGNSGPGGFAEIKDGVYDTAEKGGGTFGGPLIIRIDGFDGNKTATDPIGQPWFLNYEIFADYPRGNAVRDFDVPASAAKNLPKVTGEPP